MSRRINGSARGTKASQRRTRYDRRPAELLEWARRGAQCLLGCLYRVRREGFEHYEAAGDRVLIVANHVSFLDAVLLAVFLPHRLTFAIDPRIARLRWVRPFLAFVDVLPVDPRTPFATKALIGALDAGKKVVIFPEGRISVTGALMKIYSGPAFVADHAKATV